MLATLSSRHAGCMRCHLLLVLRTGHPGTDPTYSTASTSSTGSTSTSTLSSTAITTTATTSSSGSGSSCSSGSSGSTPLTSGFVTATATISSRSVRSSSSRVRSSSRGSNGGIISAATATTREGPATWAVQARHCSSSARIGSSGGGSNGYGRGGEGAAAAAAEEEDGGQGGGPQAPGRRRKNWGTAPALSRFGSDLTAQARLGLLDPCIGREDVINRTLQVLLRRTKNNVVLVGEPGVGKTAVVEGIAQLLASPAAPFGLAGHRLVSLDVTALVAGSAYRGEFEERLQAVLREVSAAARSSAPHAHPASPGAAGHTFPHHGSSGGNPGRVMLFIDECHQLLSAGASEGGLSAANILKPALARGELQCIGATTLEEYQRHIEKDPALARRFQPVLVEEPSAEEALLILQGLVPRYERHHRVAFSTDAVRTAVDAASRYITDRRLPDSAIDLLDEAASSVVIRAALRQHQQLETEQAQTTAAAATARAPAEHYSTSPTPLSVASSPSAESTPAPSVLAASTFLSSTPVSTAPVSSTPVSSAPASSLASSTLAPSTPVSSTPVVSTPVSSTSSSKAGGCAGGGCDGAHSSWNDAPGSAEMQRTPTQRSCGGADVGSCSDPGQATRLGGFSGRGDAPSAGRGPGVSPEVWQQFEEEIKGAVGPAATLHTSLGDQWQAGAQAGGCGAEAGQCTAGMAAEGQASALEGCVGAAGSCGECSAAGCAGSGHAGPDRTRQDGGLAASDSSSSIMSSGSSGSSSSSSNSSSIMSSSSSSTASSGSSGGGGIGSNSSGSAGASVPLYRSQTGHGASIASSVVQPATSGTGAPVPPVSPHPELGKPLPPSSAHPLPGTTTLASAHPAPGAPPPPPSASAAGQQQWQQDWESWVQEQGWRGPEEAHRQQLLHWFGATPHDPLPGPFGHRQTAEERRRAYLALMGFPEPSQNGAEATNSGGSGGAGGGRLGGGGGGADLAHHIPKACPHCGTLVEAPKALLRLCCPSCSTRFLNIDPTKLQIGASILMASLAEGSAAGSTTGTLGGLGTAVVTGWGVGSVGSVGHEGLSQSQQQLRQHSSGTMGPAASAHTSAPRLSHLAPPHLASKHVAWSGTHASPTAAHTATAILPPGHASATATNHDRQSVEWSAGIAHLWPGRLSPFPMAAATAAQPSLPGAAAAAVGTPSPPSAATAAAVTPSPPSSSSSLSSPPSPAAAVGTPSGAAPSSHSHTSPRTRPARPVLGTVEPLDVLQVVSAASGIPVSRLWSGPEGLATLGRLEHDLAAAVVGQPRAVADVARAVKAWRLGRTALGAAAAGAGRAAVAAGSRGGRAAASFLFWGPRGVGKTTLCLELARHLFPTHASTSTSTSSTSANSPAAAGSRALLRLQMAEYSERSSLSRLLGAPPGYVGFGQGGMLTSALRRRPATLVLCEDIDRAHPEVVQVLVRAVEEGQLLDSEGKVASFRNAVVVFTLSSRGPPAATPNTASGAPCGSITGTAAGAGASAGAPSSSSAVESSYAAAQASLPAAAAGTSGCSYPATLHEASGAAAQGAAFASGSSGCSYPATLHEVSGAAAHGTAFAASSSAAATSSAAAAAAAASAAAVAPRSVGAAWPPAAVADLSATVDAVVRFGRLDEAAVRQAAALQLRELSEQLAGSWGLQGLAWDDAALAWLAARGWVEGQGLKPLPALLRQQVLGPVADALLAEAGQQGLQGRAVRLTVQGGELMVQLAPAADL